VNATIDRAAAWPGLRFEDDEYVARLARLRRAMALHGLDAVVLSDDRLTWYLSGFGDVGPIGSPARPRVLVVTSMGEPAFFVHRSTRRCVEEMSAVADVRTYRALGAAPIADIAALLAERGCRRVGAELGGRLRLGMPAEDLDALRTGVPELVDAAAAVWDVRMVKSEAEVARIREACAITDRAYARALPQVRFGMTEVEAARLLRGALAEEGADAAWIWIASGKGQYGRIDGVVRQRVIEPGDLVFADMGACVGGYWADFSRSCVVGGATSRQRRLQELIREVTDLGVQALVPGRTAAGAAAVVDEAMAENGLAFSSQAERYGHGLGLLVTELPDVWRTDPTPIRPGMVLTMEPGTWTEEGMFHCEEVVVVTEEGNERLSTFDWRIVDVP
jgi:Xaa-Pro aminopeptidase